MKANNPMSLLPKKIYRIGMISIVSAFLTSGAVYGVALMFQVFTVLLGFAETSQINPLLKPLSESVFLFFSFFAGAVLLQGAGQFLQTYINIAFAETFNYEIRKVFLDTLFRPNSSWNHDLGTTSNIMAEVIPKSASYVTSVARFVTLLVQVIILGVFCIISLPLEFFISIAIFSTIAPLILYLNLKSRAYGASILSESEALNTQLMRSVKNYLFLKIIGIEQKEKEHTVKSARTYYEHYMKSAVYYSVANSVPITFITMVVVFLFYYFSMQSVATPGLLTMFYLLYRFAGGLSQMVSITNGLSMYRPNFDAIVKILHESKEAKKLVITRVNDSLAIERAEKYNLETNDLSFHYSTGTNENFIYKNLKIVLPEHQMLVIKGASGSGKTTLLMNLIGVLAQSSGQIFWGETDMGRLDMELFREKIGYMGPEPFIIAGTVRENLAYGLKSTPSNEDLWEACRIADAKEFLKAMTDGLNTQLSDLGEGLSMGQKQRLGLARALLRKPEILILDEVTANLDRKTEDAIIKNIAKLKEKMTILVSTHSVAFDSITDQILELGEEPTYSIMSQPLVA
jgi:ABC-type bacteriocin/lantibiotic exporter with double-glycine peptidase domain